eukprot:481904-Amphidinium_carterae.1
MSVGQGCYPSDCDCSFSQEEQSHMTQARETDAKEIERLQKEVAHSETRLAQEEERWMAYFSLNEENPCECQQQH